jgi:histidyl-tRNA synthetase
MLGKYGVNAEIRIDFSLARGLDYYTGFIWEVMMASDDKSKLPSIASGGRYDNLIGMYSKSQVAAVGSSIGISRVFEILRNEDGPRTYARVFIATIGQENLEYSIGVATKMRQAGIYVDMNVNERGISKQLEYANSLKIMYVAIIGAKERDSGKINFKDMQSGTEELLDIGAAIERLKK